MWKTGTSVLLGLVVSFSSLPAIMSATEAATSILFGVDIGGLAVELEIRILGERSVKVGKRGLKKVSVLVEATVLAVVVVVMA